MEIFLLGYYKRRTRKMENTSSKNQIKKSLYRIADNICSYDAKSMTLNDISDQEDICTEFQARLLRNHCIEEYFSAYNSLNSQTNNTNMCTILNELQKASTNTSDNISENVIQLQLSDIINKFILSLRADEQSVIIRRYFFADSIDDIAVATKCTTAKVSDLLNVCNTNLHNSLEACNYIVKPETLFKSFTDICDELISLGLNAFTGNLETESKALKKSNNASRRFLLFLAGGACIIIIIIAAIFLNLPAGLEETPDIMTEALNSDFKHIFGKDEDGYYVITTELLTYADDTSSPDADDSSFAHSIKFNIEAFDTKESNVNVSDVNVSNDDIINLEYSNHFLSDINILRYCLGTELSDFSNNDITYYKLLGHSDLQYIIAKSDEFYQLYKIINIDITSKNMTEDFKTDQTYCFILNNIYGIHDSEDVTKIISMPSNYNAISKPDIYSSTSVTDSDNIAYTLKTLGDLKFTNYSWLNHPLHEKCDTYYIFDTSTMFTIYTSKGSIIETVYYRYTDKYFYEFAGSVLSTISDDVHLKLDKIYKFSDIGNEYKKKWDPEIDMLTTKVSKKSITQLTLMYNHAPDIIDGLYVSNWYELERLEGNEWVKVNPKFSKPEKEECNPFSTKIISTSSNHIDFSWGATYGVLPKGHYRIITSVCNMYTYNTSNHVEQLYYSEFIID